MPLRELFELIDTRLDQRMVGREQPLDRGGMLAEFLNKLPMAVQYASAHDCNLARLDMVPELFPKDSADLS